MLRRKLLIRLGSLVMVYIIGAIVAIVLLQSVLRDLNVAGAESASTAEAIDELERAVVSARSTLEDRDLPAQVARRRLLDAGERINEAYAKIGNRPIATNAGASCYRRIGEMLPGITPHEEWLDEQGLASWREHAPAFIDDLSSEIAHLRQQNRGVSSGQQLVIARRLRNFIIGLTVAILIVLNLTIILLLRTGEMIVCPVEALVDHSRELARERFDHRVEVPNDNEFGELADSYNHLAEQLRLNEDRKMETLQQLGVSLNHELNNVIGIIELQLAYVDRHAKGDDALKTRLVQIRENLHRIVETVAALKDVRRIVVTEYVPGMKMLDLLKCANPDFPVAESFRAGERLPEHRESDAGNPV